MRITTVAPLLLWCLTLSSAASAQTPLIQASPTPGCSVSPEEREANRRAAMEFFRPGITLEQRIALIGPGYIQHNAVLKKAAQDQKISDYQAFRNAFGGANRAGGPGGPGPAGAGPGGPGAAAGPQPPPGNQLEIVTAECDLVTIVQRIVRQDPTAGPGTWYETFAFDTFRVRNGRLVEHWDGAVINAPAAPAPVPPPAGVFGGNVGHIVANMARATAFYRDVLGLTVRSDGAAPYPWMGDPALRAASIATVPIPGTMWALDLIQVARAPAAFTPRLQDPGALTLILFVQNVDSILARARAANVPVITTGGGTTGVGNNGSIKALVIQGPDGEFIELLEQAQTPVNQTAASPTPAGSNVLRGNLRITVADVEAAGRAYEALLGVTFRGGPGPITDPGVPLMLGQPGATFRLRNAQLPGSGMTLELLDITGPNKASTRVARGAPGVSYLRVGLAPSRMPAAGVATDRDNVFLIISEVQP